MSVVAAAQADPSLFMGPKVAGGLCEAILQGVLLSQARKYHRYNDDPTPLQSIALFVNLISLFQTCLAMYHLWKTFIIDFGDWHAAVATSPWPLGLQPLMTMLIAGPAQAYLIWRCWNGPERSWLKALPLCVIFGVAFVSSIAVLVWSVIIETGLGPADEHPYPNTSDVSFNIWIISTTALAVVVAVVLSTKVFNSVKRSSASRNGSSVSQPSAMTVGQRFIRFHRKVWETTLPPTICAVAMFSAYIANTIQMNDSRWLFFFQHVLGKLYCVSLMIALNARLKLDFLKDSKATSVGATASRTATRTGTRSGTSIRIEVNRQIVRDTSQAQAAVYDKKSPTTPGSKASLEQDFYTARQPEQIELNDLERTTSARST